MNPSVTPIERPIDETHEHAHPDVYQPASIENIQDKSLFEHWTARLVPTDGTNQGSVVQ